MRKAIWVLLTLVTLLACGPPTLRSRLQGRWLQLANNGTPNRVLDFEGSYVTAYIVSASAVTSSSTIVVEGVTLELSFCEPYATKNGNLEMDLWTTDNPSDKIQYKTTLSEDNNSLVLLHQQPISTPIAGIYKRVEN